MTRRRERHSELIDALERVLFPHQESEEEQESFTPEGRQRVDRWLETVIPSRAIPTPAARLAGRRLDFVEALLEALDDPDPKIQGLIDSLMVQWEYRK